MTTGLASCPAWVEDALWEAARACLPPRALARSSLLAAIAERTLRYTSERDRLAAPLSASAADSDLAARALFYSVADVAKMIAVLRELDARGAFPASSRLRVADLGAGAGAMSLGLVAFLADRSQPRPVELWAVDQDKAALEIARHALAGAVDRIAGSAVECSGGDLARWSPRGEFDLVLAGTVLNELPDRAARLAVVRRAVSSLSSDGAAIFIEPALRDTSRDLQQLRDEIVTSGEASVFAPCTRRGTPCPMLAADDMWCHEHRPTQLPKRMAQLSAATGLRDGGLKFSYLTLRRRGTEQSEGRLQDSLAARRALRAVSALHKQKGKVELLACGDGGLAPLRLLKRNRSPHNRAFLDARRGDVVVVSGEDDIRKTDEIEVIRHG